MTAQDLKAAGYNVSPLIDDALVTRLEKLVANAYIEPVMGDYYDAGDAEQFKAAQALVFIALNDVNVHATRAGAKIKVAPQLSERGYVTQLDFEQADRRLRWIQSRPSANKETIDKVVNDVLHIYARSYVGLNK